MIETASLLNEQVEQLIKHFENEVFDLDDPALALNTGSKWADNQRLALDALYELKRKRAKIADLEARIAALEANDAS